MRIRPCGAVGEVTGSGYLIEFAAEDGGQRRLLVDFGMFQGRGDAFKRNPVLDPVDPQHLDAVVLTHAHLDHCGRLPLLAANGYRGRVHATSATIDLAKIVLEDSAHIQVADSARESRRRERLGRPPVFPLYRQAEVDLLQPLMSPLELERPMDVLPGVTLRFFEAGHILGSASVELTIRESDGGTRTVVFSGDIGQRGTPVLRDPVLPCHADLVFMESTYGDRNHRKRQSTLDEFNDALKAAAWAKQRVIIPAFAIGRTQQLLYDIAAAVREEAVPDFPIYLDSPTARKATQVYLAHQDLYDAEAAGLFKCGRMLRDVRNLKMVETVEESKALNESWEPCVIIAASGMCDGGRIVHHLKHNLWRRGVQVLLTGYMAEGSLGRRLVDGAKEVEIHGDNVPVRATIHTLGGFSAHAGQSELLDWLQLVAAEKPQVVLTHGEDRARAALAVRIRERYGIEPRLASPGDVIE